MYLDGHFSPPANRNRLRVGGLPDGIFEPLSREVKTFWIWGSPGSDSFRPRAADAGPGGTLSAGQTVTLGGPGNDGGPWGSNVYYRWRQTDGDGDPASTVALPVTAEENVVANPSFTVPALAETTEVRFRLLLDGAGQTMDGSAHDLGARIRVGLYSPASEARFTILGLAPTGVAVVSKPVDGGDTYKGGEKIEVAVTFGDRVLVDTSLGMPTLALTVGTQTRQAAYAGGTGTNRLVFEYTVQSADIDGDGIAIAANGLDARRRRHRERLRRGGDSRPRRAGGADRSQGRPVGRYAGQRHLRAHAPGARRAAGAGHGERQQCQHLLGRDDDASGRADRDPGSGQQRASRS